MAFELPDHVPRGGDLSRDRPTHVLTKIGQATHKTLNASLTASWLAELDKSITDTKHRISQRIHDDLPAFEDHIKSFTSIQARLGTLSTTVDGLTESLNNPKTGILPTLLQSLTAHGNLSAQAHDSDTTYHALEHLLRIRDELNGLTARMQQGELPESVQACVRVQELINESPNALQKSDVMSSIKKKYRMLYDRSQEQLGDAYGRSVVFTNSKDIVSLIIRPTMQVPPTSTIITLAAILQSLTPDLLSSRLAVFRRDLMSKLVDPVLCSSREITISNLEGSPILSLSSSSSSSSSSSTTSTPLQSLRLLITFLDTHFYPNLPSAQAPFPNTLYTPITAAILTHLLKHSIPSSLQDLPSFVSIVDDAVRFEDFLLTADTRNRPIHDWAEDVAGHYERKRREVFLLKTRTMVTSQEDGATLRINVPSSSSLSSPTADDENPDMSAWDFDDDDNEGKAKISAPDSGTISTKQVDQPMDVVDDEQDSSDAWGWGDSIDDQTEETLVQQEESASEVTPNKEGDDDAWDDDGWSTEPVALLPLSSPEQPDENRVAAPLKSTQTPKTATRLEKFSAKAKGQNVPGTPDTPTLSRAPAPGSAMPQSFSLKKILMEKDSYLVSVRAKKVLEIAEEVLREGHELLQSKIFEERPSGNRSNPGDLLLAAAPSILDVHLALYPITHSVALAHDLNLSMRWSNDCIFLSREVLRLESLHSPTQNKWAEIGERLQTIGEVSFEDVVVRQQDAVRNILIDAGGFVNVSNHERFVECKSTIERARQEITSIAQQWKDILTRSQYFRAIGQIVDDALFRVMDDILSLEDIPEADSERLSELCESLAPLEELFVYSPDEGSIIGSHVPLWFKFSYLSWLIKGSIADISYLFDQGMLVDYEIDELVRLLRALFAETPLRENTIAKVMKGHPLSENE